MENTNKNTFEVFQDGLPYLRLCGEVALEPALVNLAFLLLELTGDFGHVEAEVQSHIPVGEAKPAEVVQVIFLLLCQTVHPISSCR